MSIEKIIVNKEHKYLTLRVNSLDLPGITVSTKEFDGERGFRFLEKTERMRLKIIGEDPNAYEYKKYQVDLDGVMWSLARYSARYLEDMLLMVRNIKVDEINYPSKDKEENSYTAEIVADQKVLARYIAENSQKYGEFVRAGGTDSWKARMDIDDDRIQRYRGLLVEAKRNNENQESLDYWQSKLDNAYEQAQNTRWTAALAFYIENNVNKALYLSHMQAKEKYVYCYNTVLIPEKLLPKSES